MTTRPNHSARLPVTLTLLLAGAFGLALAACGDAPPPAYEDAAHDENVDGGSAERVIDGGAAVAQPDAGLAVRDDDGGAREDQDAGAPIADAGTVATVLDGGAAEPGDAGLVAIDDAGLDDAGRDDAGGDGTLQDAGVAVADAGAGGDFGAACTFGEATATCYNDIAYGDDPLQTYDLIVPDGASDAPLVVYVHGGGYITGDKESAYTSQLFAPERFLEAGAAYATLNYRLSGDNAFYAGTPAPYPVMMADAATALQKLRYEAPTFGIDPERVAFTGGSAGGGISLWLALHDDLATGPAGTQSSMSTRVDCVALSNTQTTLDMGEVMALIGPDGYVPDAGLLGLYGLDEAAYFADPDTYHAALSQQFALASPLAHLDANDSDVQVMLTYQFDYGVGDIHSPEFGRYAIEGLPSDIATTYGRTSMDAVGIDSTLLVGATNLQQRLAVRSHIATCLQ